MCNHLWLPHRGWLFVSLVCRRCHERRRVRFSPAGSPGVAATLTEAIDRGVVSRDEVTWGGRHLR